MWLGFIKGQHEKWNKREVIGISKFLAECNKMCPLELHRTIRELDEIKFWKGTEFRTFLHYTGIVALKNRVTQPEYEMFTTLFCAVTICSSNMYTKLLPAARKLFIDFIETHIDLFGESSITINIHNTSHVVDDVEMFGPLDTISAYPFENYLYQLKRKLQPGKFPLQQIARRIIEAEQCKKKLSSVERFPVLEDDFLLPDGNLVYKSLKYKAGGTLTSTAKNKWFLTTSNNIVEFEYVITDVNRKTLIRGSPLKNSKNFFVKPFDSKHLNIFLSDGDKNEPQYFELNNIKAKMFCIPYENKFVFTPLLHTL